jgi:uncharacterized RDD family membrane protein YckC
VIVVSAQDVRSSTGGIAGFVSRFVAAAFDFLVVIAFVGAVYLALAGVRFIVSPRRFDWPTIGALALAFIAWGFLIVYLTVGWAGTGRSVGKQVMGLRVQRLDGTELGLGQAFIRAALCAAFPVGLVWTTVSRSSASLQDLIVRTKVVYDWLPRIPHRQDGR